MSIAVAVVVIVAFLVGVALGATVLASRHRTGRSGAASAAARVPASELPAGRARVGQPLAPLVVDALDAGVAVVDRDEFVVFVNPAARAMGILDAGTLAFTGLVNIARRALETAERVTGSVDLPMGRLGREPIALSVVGVPLPEVDGRVPGVCLLLSDVSEQRRLEAVRRDFVANVSHELKTPVGALTLLAEAIVDAADEPAAVARFAGRIQHEGARLARLVGELMELSRVQGADPLPGAGEVDLRSIVAEAIERNRLSAEQASITVTESVPVGLRVRGNEAQLATAVANLVENAIAYSSFGTRVAVSARATDDDETPPTVDLTVTDQGIGIAEADRDRIFERFYRVDPARSRATGGTGLGLAIVKNIVTNHLGTVSVWSVNGSGSTFTIRLPRVHSDASLSLASTESAQLTAADEPEAQPVTQPTAVKGAAT